MVTCLSITLFFAVSRPGDAFYVRFFRDAALSDTFFVEADTSVYVPMAGQLILSGMEKEEAASFLEDTLSSFYSRPLVKVYPLSRVYLTGQVEKPGPVYLMPSQTFLEAVATVGTREKADLARVKVLRDGETIGLDLNGSSRKSLPVDGDVIVVPKSPWPSLMEVYYVLAGVAVTWSLYLNVTRK